MSPSALLKSVAHALGFRIQIVEKRYAASDLFHLLASYSAQLSGQGLRLILLLDDAHLLSAEALKAVKSITCLENSSEKLATCVLLGEPRLKERLNHEVFASLKSRLYLNLSLEPLSQDEIQPYLLRRLAVAGIASDFFSKDELESLCACPGNFRELNKQAYALFTMKQRERLEAALSPV
jgi:type II secretory pathway predicted ATPase ExeA